MEPEVSVPCSQEPATGPYPGPDKSNPCPPTLFHFDIILPPTRRSSEWSLPFKLPNQNFLPICHFPMRATYSVYFILLDFNILITVSHFITCCFLRCGFVRTRPTPKLKDHPLSALRHLFNIFPAVWEAVSSIRNLRTRHVAVSRDPLNMDKHIKQIL
jgi:hypothetical protein